jgi:hypothetical protein
MADLVTHLCTGAIFKAVSGRPHVPVFMLGTVAPDLLSRIPSMGLTRLSQWGLPIPPAVVHSFEPLHLPMGMVLFSALLALFFPAEHRRGVLGNFLGGMFLHLAVDLAQDHHGVGYVLGYPLVRQPFELALVSSEASVFWAPVLVLISVGLVAWRRRVPGSGRDSTASS